VRDSKGEMVVRGNCYAAAIASMLELPLSEVPNVEVLFHIEGGFWSQVMHAFLNSVGYELYCNDDYRVFHDPEYRKEEREQLIESLKDNYYMVSGMSPRGVNHIVIYQNGRMVHDPHPTREGILDMQYFEEIVKKSGEHESESK